MATKPKKITASRSWYYYLLLMLPTIGALLWSSFSTLETISAAVTYQPLVFTKDDWELPQNNEKIRRHLQMHFLKFRQYIAIDDIIIANTDVDPDEKKLLLMMSKTCGNAKVYVWLPLSFKLPIWGTRVWEWCWRPRTKIKD